ncbi:Multicopper oxidase abr1 [Penicillium argentinense]|uniref:Multicopper oxidase abr1 n=1 Tax=Penicillium argentinense TaxID=1131581 RepID=A0A9W9FGJ7_9EURO|nr:Multicopper oxidase abr1 [Penicillium argentinense]KAJ5099685.1 Multicopper oxidase abr1 [Penicillium argentinense]
MGKFNLLALAGLAANLAVAKEVYLDWNVTWVNASPDGFERPVIGINGQWPCPQVDVEVGDRVIVDVYNGLGNQSTGIHWHGFHQYGTGIMDGSSSVTQCPIPLANQTGTYWYHSHNMGQYPDGFRGSFIVHDPNPPFHYDEEFTLTLSDWYHEQMPNLLNQYESLENQKNNRGLEPLPDSALINDSTNTKIKVQPGKTYLVHIICLGNWPGHAWVFDGHEMTVVEIDGVYVDPYPAGDKMLRIAPGQRMGVLIHTKNDASQNFAIWDTMDVNMMFFYQDRPIPDGYNPNATAWLVYDDAKPLPPPPSFSELDFVDDLSFVPVDKEPLLQPMHHQIILDTYDTEINGVKRFTINNKTYIPQDVPTLYTANTIGANFSSNPEVYGQVNPIIVKYGEIVEIVINNHHNNLHPWHLHGHQFQVVQRTTVDGGYFTGAYWQNISHTPVRRDTIMVQNHGHAVIRFRADNPGVWLLHCHVEWHVEAGLMATIIEAPETFPQSQKAPLKSHYEACAAYPDPSNGNAAGKHGLDLKGAHTVVPVGSNGAMYPPNAKPVAPLPVTTAAAPPPPETTSAAPPPPAQPTHTQSPPPEQPPAPKPTHPHGPPPFQPPAPKPTAEQPAPAPHAPPHAPAPAPAQPAPEVVPQYEPIPFTEYYPESYPENEPIYAQEQDGQNHDHGHGQVGDGKDGVAPTYGDSQDTKGPWPQPHTDKSHGQVGDDHEDQPLVAHTEDTKGPWPNPHTNNGYVKEGGHTYKTPEDTYPNLPKDYQYWGQYERKQ